MTPVVEPESINGDLPLSREQRVAYMQHHEARNAELAERSIGIATRIGPRPLRRRGDLGSAVTDGCSPGRVAAVEFFAHAAACIAAMAGDRPVTIVDVGAGAGGQLDAFIDAGLRGRYIAIDIARHRKWKDGPRSHFERTLIVADVNRFDAGTLPPIDVLVSNTALEHIRDDAGAIRSLSTRLAAGAAQAHFVPAEAALHLYGPHGSRQYSPWCLEQRFPTGEIFRYGGPAAAAVHREWITPATQAGGCRRDQDPAAYRRLRDLAMDQDEQDGNTPALMYGVLVAAASARS
ncbi:MAG: class I SAM-dependent methyltransferase [Phycisphaerae bacterium]